MNDLEDVIGGYMWIKFHLYPSWVFAYAYYAFVLFGDSYLPYSFGALFVSSFMRMYMAPVGTTCNNLALVYDSQQLCMFIYMEQFVSFSFGIRAYIYTVTHSVFCSFGKYI